MTTMTTTPSELAHDLDVSAKTILAFLREEYPEHKLGARWELDDEQATMVRARFSD
jgi:DNA-binding XRE family transcriptional regulator